MAKESSFRVCIALLLFVQALCWSLTLLDLLSPGKLRIVLHTATETLAPLLSALSAVSGPSAVSLSYRSIMELV